MLKANLIALALALVPAAVTVYVDTLPGGPPWTPAMFALDFVLMLALWHVMALATLNVIAVWMDQRGRVRQARERVEAQRRS